MSVSVDAPSGVVSDVAGRLRLLGEPTRLEIVRRLAVEDLCTCHLVGDLQIAQSLVSHHLRVLREAGIVRPEPAGAFTYYVLQRTALAELAGQIDRLSQDPGQRRRRSCT